MKMDKELKTLKDLNMKGVKTSSKIRIKKELKLEAVKWVKGYYHANNIGKALEEQAGKGAFKDIEEKEKEVIDWIKHFFNLKEEDLI